ncbi:MAG: 7-cyano-7-deazaguanine synthase QueC [Planctomycetaceae bacterium]
MNPSRKAVVLLSGGLDSATVLAIARAEGFETHALTVAYGQRHATEIQAARVVAKALGANAHMETTVDLRRFGGSALTSDIAVPKHRDARTISAGIPITYVPARNTVLLSVALAWAEVVGAFDLFVGINAVDYSGYPDCRPDFIAAFEHLANVATKAAVEGEGRYRVHAPLVSLSKAAIIRRGISLGVDYGMTLSCYDPDADGFACGHCDACHLRRRGFEEAGLADPTRYAIRG